jgi:DNA-binding transcriptional LysR family regulator
VDLPHNVRNRIALVGGSRRKSLIMDLHQLRMFTAVAEFGNLTQAAEHLHLSQPAASAQIKQLEEEFRVALFDRRSTGLALTQIGALLLPRVQQLLASTNELLAQARSFSGRAVGTVRFATIMADFYKPLLRLGEMVNLIAARYPLLNVEFQHRTSRFIIAGIASGEFDAGIALGNKDIPQIHSIPLRELHYRIIAPRAWNDRVRNASWRELAALPWVSCPPGGTHREMAIQLLKRYGRQLDKVIEADSEQILINLVSEGVGLGLMREDIALEEQASGNLVVIEKGRTSTHLRICYCADRENDPTIQAILDVLRDLWPNAERLFPPIALKPSQQISFAHRRARPTKRPRQSISSR